MNNFENVTLTKKKKNAPARNAPQPHQSKKEKENVPARNAPQPRQSLEGKKNHPIIQSNNPIQYSYQFIIFNTYPMNFL